MKLGYNTNGFAHHRLEDALDILFELGYESVAITLDYHALNPFDAALPRQLDAVRRQLDDLHLDCVIETGARFLLDPRRKHQPTLLDPDPAERLQRLNFLCRAIEIAGALEAEAVSFWSGTPVTDEATDVLHGRLVDGCRGLAQYAGDLGVRLAFEPEPGMFIDTLDKFTELHESVASQSFGLTVDVGHLHCLGEVPIPDKLRPWKDWLWNLHIEDMRRGVHDHLMFGEGEMEFEPILQALHEIGYAGGVHVELSRHSHDAVRTAQQARDYLLARWPR